MILSLFSYRICSLDLAETKCEKRSRKKPSGLWKASTNSPKSCRGIDWSADLAASYARIWRVATAQISNTEAVTVSEARATACKKYQPNQTKWTKSLKYLFGSCTPVQKGLVFFYLVWHISSFYAEVQNF